MALLQENLAHTTMLSGSGRPSPSSFYSAYGHGFVSTGAQAANGASGTGPMGPYGGGPEHGQYSHGYGIPVGGYEAASPSLQQQQQQQQQAGEAGSNAIPGQWAYHGGQLQPRPAHVTAGGGGLEDWGQQYLQMASAAPPPPPSSGTPPMHHVHHGHPHQHPHYGYPYRIPASMDGYDHHGMVDTTSPSTEGDSPPGGGGSGSGSGGAAASGTKQLRPPFEWMKPANVQPAPGKTRTKDKYRVVYSDHQRLELEKEFHFSRYITIRRKAEIAQQLSLSERQVKIWFQNRRAKERKQKKKEDAIRASGAGVPKLEPLDSPPPIATQHGHHGHTQSPNMGMNMHQHHLLSQSGSGANGGLPHPVGNHHLASSMTQQLYQQHRLSPASSQGIVHESHALPQTATPTAGSQLPDSASISCSVAPVHQSQSVPTPSFEEKQESV